MRSSEDVASAPPRSARILLAIAAVAVAFAAADTYVVVLSLPDMMTSVGLSVEQLQRAAPIVSGFLLGYVAMLPLIGRIADLRGRIPVLVAALIVFAFGSLITAAAYDLGSLVAGRFLQGVGGGGLVPVTLALVADLYPADRRGVPLGVVGAVQELGSVLGPLYGAMVLHFGTWRDIFWINLAVGLVLAAALVSTPAARSEATRSPRRVDPVGLLLLAGVLAVGLMVMMRPKGLVTSVTWGAPFVPFVHQASRWFSPLGATTIVLSLALIAWCWWARAPMVDLRGWVRSVRRADLPGASLLAIALGGVILAFATADPEVQVFSPAGPWYLGAAAVATILLVLHLRRAENPLIPQGAFTSTPAWGSLVASFFIGAALIAALIDIPIFARVSSVDADQLHAALVLVEFLIALPVGALAGGVLLRWLPAGAIAAAGMLLAAGGFWVMGHWSYTALEHLSASVVLAGTGLGFGLALAPVNAALLATTKAAVHGVASALLVVARMVGMLIGISALTTIGLRRYYAVESDIPQPKDVCGGTRTRCAEYTRLIENAGIEQLHAIFLGAAIAAFVAAAVSLWCFRGADTRGKSVASLLPG